MKNKNKVRIILVIIALLAVVVDIQGKTNYRKIVINSSKDVLPMDDKLNVERVIYDMGKVDLSEFHIPAKKKAFIGMMVPTALIVIEEIEVERAKVKGMSSGKIKKNQKFLDDLYKKYRVEDKNITTLYKKMKPAPISILLAQSSIESAWGTSRMFKAANNVFGVWSIDPNESRIKSGAKRGDRQIYLKKYPTLKGSIEDYMHLLARQKAYSGFRAKLQITTNYKTLSKELINYSEQREVYTKKLIDTISYNKFDKYDSYKLKSK
ncbi:MAG: glucosaminidase domain-containing protein [Psychrilyobacter sp.]|nr:glucosaminidase domain-containing protein [Psychrilyobacter sp.]